MAKRTYRPNNRLYGRKSYAPHPYYNPKRVFQLVHKRKFTARRIPQFKSAYLRRSY